MSMRIIFIATLFSFCCQGHAPRVGLGVLVGGVENFSLRICDGAPSTARSSYCYMTKKNPVS